MWGLLGAASLDGLSGPSPGALEAAERGLGWGAEARRPRKCGCQWMGSCAQGHLYPGGASSRQSCRPPLYLPTVSCSRPAQLVKAAGCLSSNQRLPELPVLTLLSPSELGLPVCGRCRVAGEAQGLLALTLTLCPAAQPQLSLAEGGVGMATGLRPGWAPGR